MKTLLATMLIASAVSGPAFADSSHSSLQHARPVTAQSGLQQTNVGLVQPDGTAAGRRCGFVGPRGSFICR